MTNQIKKLPLLIIHQQNNIILSIPLNMSSNKNITPLTDLQSLSKSLKVGSSGDQLTSNLKPRQNRRKHTKRTTSDSSGTSNDDSNPSLRSPRRKTKKKHSKLDADKVYRVLELIDYKIKRKDVDYTNSDSNLAEDFEELFHGTQTLNQLYNLQKTTIK